MITLRVRYCYVQSLTSLISPEITRRDHSTIACSRHIYEWCCSSRTSRSWWITHSTQHHRRGCNTTMGTKLKYFWKTHEIVKSAWIYSQNHVSQTITFHVIHISWFWRGYKVEIFLKYLWNCEVRQNLIEKSCITNNYLSCDPYFVILAWVQSWNIFLKLMKVCSPPEFFLKNMSHELLLFTWSIFCDSTMGRKLKYFWKTHETVKSFRIYSQNRVSRTITFHARITTCGSREN